MFARAQKKPPLVTMLFKQNSLTISSFNSHNTLLNYHLRTIALEKSEVCNYVLFNQKAAYQLVENFLKDFQLPTPYFLIGVDIKTSHNFLVHHYFHYVLFTLKYNLRCLEIVSSNQALDKGLESFEHLSKNNHLLPITNPDSAFLESLGLHTIGTQHYE